MRIEDLDTFRTWLAAQLPGEAVSPPGPLLPTPDRQVSVQDYDSGGAGPNWQGNYRVQVRCRSQTPAAGINVYREAHQLADKVVLAVAPPRDRDLVIELSGGHRATVKLLSGPLPLGPDLTGRWEFTINVALETSRV